jgi:hypothetical protein
MIFLVTQGTIRVTMTKVCRFIVARPSQNGAT